MGIGMLTIAVRIEVRLVPGWPLSLVSGLHHELAMTARRRDPPAGGPHPSGSRKGHPLPALLRARCGALPAAVPRPDRRGRPAHPDPDLHRQRGGRLGHRRDHLRPQWPPRGRADDLTEPPRTPIRGPGGVSLLRILWLYPLGWSVFTSGRFSTCFLVMSRWTPSTTPVTAPIGMVTSLRPNTCPSCSSTWLT